MFFKKNKPLKNPQNLPFLGDRKCMAFSLFPILQSKSCIHHLQNELLVQKII